MVGSESLTPPTEAAPPPKKYGVTKPLSLSGPTEADLQRNAALEKFLKESDLYESEEETARREEVLHQLDQMVLAEYNKRKTGMLENCSSYKEVKERLLTSN
ncbi:hypothetical protein HAX54_026121 [Datura stramonium]|uniref:Poly(A) polymerase nucleotidyltransferase domain-containing protein n=1 Tax=Datura stramonium TaxID=4076 RepID=A0ABS8V297_DATST|nr:hypothetical protein [Datura stramonium]